MAEVLRAEPPLPAQLDQLVNFPLVRLWLYWGMFWLLLTPTFGVMISIKF
jgi:cytochrome c oxidase cbb3-type subunit 1